MKITQLLISKKSHLRDTVLKECLNTATRYSTLR